MHTLATIICYEVLENVVCPSPSMKCCVESPTNTSTTTVSPPQYSASQRHPQSTTTTSKSPPSTTISSTTTTKGTQVRPSFIVITEHFTSKVLITF